MPVSNYKQAIRKTIRYLK